MLEKISPFLLLLICFISCKKDEGTPKTNAFLSKVTTDDEERRYHYDQQNRLIKIEWLSNSGIVYVDTVIYNVNSLLEKSITTTKALLTNQYYYTYLRNGKGQIIRKTGTMQTGSLAPNDHSYAYDDKGRVIADTTYYQQTSSIVSYVALRYDVNNNISELQTHDLVNPNNSAVNTYSYDTKPNPYHLQGFDYFFVTNSIKYLMQNNMIAAKSSRGMSVSIQTEYNSSGLPVSMKVVYATGATGSTTKLEYR